MASRFCTVGDDVYLFFRLCFLRLLHQLLGQHFVLKTEEPNPKEKVDIISDFDAFRNLYYAAAAVTI